MLAGVATDVFLASPVRPPQSLKFNADEDEGFWMHWMKDSRRVRGMGVENW
jgi:hypothetical protein